MLGLVDRHEAEEAGDSRTVVGLHLVNEFPVALFGLLLHQDGEVEGVFEGQIAKIDVLHLEILRVGRQSSHGSTTSGGCARNCEPCAAPCQATQRAVGSWQ